MLKFVSVRECIVSIFKQNFDRFGVPARTLQAYKLPDN